MEATQYDDTATPNVAPLAEEHDLVLDIARGLYNVDRAHNAAVQGVALAEYGPRDARDSDLHAEGPALARNIAYVRDVLAGKTDAEVWEREIPEGSNKIVSAEEYAAARIAAGDHVPLYVFPPYSHALPRRKRADALRRAFVLATAEEIAQRDAHATSLGGRWQRGTSTRGAPEA